MEILRDSSRLNKKIIRLSLYNNYEKINNNNSAI